MVSEEWSKNGLKFFLYNRKQIAKYTEVPSEETTIRSGVPKGSVLDSLLFLVYINDIQYWSELISIVLFADVANIVYSRTCLKIWNEIIPFEINKIVDWLNANTVQKKKIFFLEQQIWNLNIT
jgi:hypothetical protein